MNFLKKEEILEIKKCLIKNNYCILDNKIPSETIKNLISKFKNLTKDENNNLFENKKMKEESSTQIDSNGNIIYLDKNPINAICLTEVSDDTKNIVEYIKTFSKELSLLNEYIEDLDLVCDEKILPYNKIAVCFGENAKLPSINYSNLLEHLDNNGLYSDDLRKLTIILYLNNEYEEEFGGKLRLYPYFKGNNHEHVDIEPICNRLVFFYSDYMVHEVLETKKGFLKRFTISFWISTKYEENIQKNKFLIRDILIKHFS
jgi:Rps23 Pro-64 3,4-dihydroxylase Tpa1-like proline 4-hydroxylase